MPKPTKKAVRSTIARAKQMLERNADPCETFEGVLPRTYVASLHTLIVLGEDFLAMPVSFRPAGPKHA